MTQALARQYRPKSFCEVIGQTHVVRALRYALEHKKLHHAYLFTGTRGVGKTTIARIVAKCLNCETRIASIPCQTCINCKEIDSGRFPDLLEVDAASRTKVEDTRELLDNVQYSPSKGRYKIYLIDEFHMLSTHSFNALLKTLEEPPPHVIFLLATTDHQGLPPTVLSRCLQFHLQLLPSKKIDRQIEMILKKEDVPFDSSAIPLISRSADGSMRDALNLLDQAIVHGNGQIRKKDLETMLGTIEITAIQDILKALKNDSAEALMKVTETLSKKTTDFTQVLNNLLDALHELAIIKAVPKTERDISHEVKEFSSDFSPEDIQLYYQIALMGQRDLPYAPSTRTGFEMTLLRMQAFIPNVEQQQEKIYAIKNMDVPKKSLPKATAWNDIINHLQINGATLALAQQCEQIKLTETELHLSLDPKQKAFLQKKYIERIQKEVTKYFAKPILIKIELKRTGDQTPSNIAKEIAIKKHFEAENAILSDEKVKKIMKTFDATIIKDTIALVQK